MKKIAFIILSVVLCFSCDDEEKAIETVLEEVDRGAVIRTVNINNGEFEVGSSDSLFSVILEEQDIENGNLMRDITIYLSFIDNTPEIGAFSTDRIVLETILPDAFENGINDLPVITLEYSFQELATASGVDIIDVFCKDQFRIDLDLNLTNGETFNLQNSAGTVVNTTGFLKSPFTYLINVVEPITSELFTGVYMFTSIEDGYFGPSFGPDRLVTITKGHSNNVRMFDLVSATNFNRTLIEFSVVCDAAVIRRYQRLALTCSGGFMDSDPSDRVLLGPDIEPGPLDSSDDTVFELHFLEAFEGFNAFCDYTDFPSKVRFSKQ
jgi:hypothetical protein